MESVSLVENGISGKSVKVSVNGNQYIFEYPCESTSICTDYQIKLLPGLYKFELYGASGGSHVNKVSSYRNANNNFISNEIVKKYNGNIECVQVSSNGGAGGYIAGTIKLSHKIDTFLTIGGKGSYTYKFHGNNPQCFLKENLIKGGYGGGGSSANFNYSNDIWETGSGGGQTAVKFLENDLWHRVLVSGGGGGTDDFCGTFGKGDDGSGGSGGNFTAQSWFQNGILQNQYVANSVTGFTFGTGEAARWRFIH